MPDGLSFDELNKLYEEENDGNLRSMPYEQYFGEMDLSQRQIENRIASAKKIEQFILPALMSMYYMMQEDAYWYEDDTASTLVTEYKSFVEQLDIPLTAYFAAMHIDTTVSNIVNATMRHLDDPYYFSNDRARLIAENEANSIWNDSEYEEAILSGKTRKRWSAIIDKATRETHLEVNGADVPIDQPFEVGGFFMQFPRDDSYGADAGEIVNCRCSVIYY